MSCNGCRALRKGCSQSCTLRPCLDWIEGPQAQSNATLFVSKFFGRSDLMSFIADVPENNRPALFQSLLFEACGRTVNPVNGAIGLLSTGNWHVCQAAVQTVLAGGTLRPISSGISTLEPEVTNESSTAFRSSVVSNKLHQKYWYSNDASRRQQSDFDFSDESEMLISFESGPTDYGVKKQQMGGGEEPKLLNLFV